MTRVKNRDGHSINCRIVDLTDPWTTPETIVLHHGLGKTGEYWYAWTRALAPKFRVVALDVLGHGESSKPRGRTWSMENYAQDVIDVLDALGVNRTHFVAEGMGGCVGLYLGARHGDRLHTLSIISTPYRPKEGRAELDQWSKKVARTGLADFINESLPDRLDWSRFPPEMYEWFREQRLKTSPRITSEQMLAQNAVDLEWALPLIKTPTLLIVPGASAVNADSQMHTMAERIAISEVAAFPEERQWVTFGRADDCAAAVTAFIAKQRSSTTQH